MTCDVGVTNGGMSNRICRVSLTAYFLLLFCFSATGALVTQICCWIFGFPILIMYPSLRIEFMGRILRFYYVLGGFYLNPFWALRIVRTPPKSYNPSDTLLMVNHVSAADPWCVSKAIFPWEFKFVFKSGLYKVPICGWGLWLSNDIPIHFTKAKGGWGTAKGSVASTMETVKKLMDQNHGVAVFPEGTRSMTGGLQPFKDGFFRYAVENGCEILPCVIHNSTELWPIGTLTIHSGTAYAAFGDPFRVAVGEYTVEQLKEKVKNEMLNLFTYCPKHDPVKEKPLDALSENRGHGIGGKTRVH